MQGSIDALREAFGRLSTDEVQVTVIHASVGGVTESDVLLASASNAIIVGFNVRPEPKAAALAEREGVDIRLYTIIYDAINQVREALEGMLEPTVRERTVGRAEVRQIFGVSGAGVIARLLGERRQDPARRAGATAARPRGGPPGQDRQPAALQGRRARGRGRATSAASGSRASTT